MARRYINEGCVLLVLTPSRPASVTPVKRFVNVLRTWPYRATGRVSNTAARGPARVTGEGSGPGMEDHGRQEESCGMVGAVAGGVVLLALLSACAGAPDPAAQPQTAAPPPRPRRRPRAPRRSPIGPNERGRSTARPSARSGAGTIATRAGSRCARAGFTRPRRRDGAAQTRAAVSRRPRQPRASANGSPASHATRGTCTAAEKRIVRGDGATPAGCDAYAAGLAAEPKPSPRPTAIRTTRARA